MDKTQVLSAIKKVREQPKKKFNQTFDLILNLRNLNIKDPNQKVDHFVVLPKKLGRKRKVYGLVDKDLQQQARDTLEGYSEKDSFKSLDDKTVKKLAKTYDVFLAQATIMVDIAKKFGKVLGMKGKMPSPKAGQVIPPNSNLKEVYEKMQNTVRLVTNKDLSVKVPIGKEDMKDEDLIENIMFIYNFMAQHLPQEKHNIKSIMIKTTMGQPVVIGKDEQI
ncbi:MAG: hypothetical protein PHG05_01410 [Candidatus Nanoarchaeia archaeon]|nr:hypothetical protein [Candidatus Nanoarchaeia archaeon]